MTTATARHWRRHVAVSVVVCAVGVLIPIAAGADAPVVITTQPTDLTVTAGSTATFTAAASGDPTPTVQWERSTDNGGTFEPVVGGTDPALSFTAAAGDNQALYRATFTNSTNAVTTDEVRLTVQYAPIVTTQPISSATVQMSVPVTLTSAASANPAPTVQWQQSTNGGSTWTNIAGATNPSWDVVTLFSTPRQYRALWTNALGSTPSNTATITTTSGVPVFTTNLPNAAVLTVGTPNSFTVAATGPPVIAYQWQKLAGFSFANIRTGPTLTLTGQVGDAGFYRVLATNQAGTQTSNTMNLAQATAPIISVTPASPTVSTGTNVTLQSSTNGFPTPAKQWQRSVDGGSTWSDLAGETGVSLSLGAVPISLNGTRYRVVATNVVGTRTSNVVVLTINQPPIVTTQPADVTVTQVGANASFTAEATGGPVPTVQWQRSGDGGATWANVTGESTSPIAGGISSTYSLSVQATDDGSRYRAVFTNSQGTTNSNPAVVSLSAAAISLQPDDVTLLAGGDATFSAAATGGPTGVQWQVSTDGGTVWNDVAGATSTSLTISGVTIAMDGRRYRAVFTYPGDTAATRPAVLTVRTLPTVSTQPANATVAIGTPVTFTASGTGYPTPSLQWERSNDGGATWSAVSGATSESYTIGYAVTSDSGARFRAVFTNAAGSVPSNSATLTVSPGPTITSHPADQIVGATFDTTFQAVATTTGPSSVRWERSNDGGSTWATVPGTSTPLPGATMGTLTFDTSFADNGARVRAVFTDATGSATTRSALLTVQKQGQTITMGAPGTTSVVGVTSEFHPSSTSGLPVTLTVSGACTISGYYVTATAVGTCQVTGSQAGDLDYLPAPNVTVSVTAKQRQTITFDALPTGLGVGSTFTVVASASSGLPVTFAASGPCTVAGATVTITAAGTCYVTASQAGDATWYTAANVVQATTVATVKLAQSITFAPLPATPVVGQAVYMSASASSGLGVTFTVSGGGCTVVNATLRFQSAGVTCTVTAVQNGNATYLAAPPVVQTAVAAPGPQSILIAGLPQNLSPGATFVVTATSTSGLAVTLSASGACTIDGATSGSTVTITGSGTCSVTATQPGDGNWLAAPTLVRTSVVKAPQTITFPALAVGPAVGTTRTLTATSSSGLGVTYTASGGCTVVNSTLRFTSVSECTVTATQPGNANFLAATPVVRSTTAVQGSQTITVGSVPVNVVTGGTYVVTATASSGLPVSVVVSGPCSTPDSVVPATVTMTASGTCMVVLTQPGDANYAAAPAVSRSTIAKAAQSITFPDLPVAPMVGTTRTLGATSSSGLGVTYTASGGCTVVNTTLRFTTVSAACTVTATQAGNVMWFAATPVTRSTTAVPGAQTIQIAALPQNQSVGATFVVTATATSTLPVTLAASGACSIAGSVSGSTVTITGAGTCSVTATQGGNADWLAAPTVVRTSIVRAPQTITFELPVAPVAGTTVTLTGSSSAGLGLTYVASGACTIVNFTRLRFDTAGAACTVTATQPGNTYYLPATPVTRTTTIT